MTIVHFLVKKNPKSLHRRQATSRKKTISMHQMYPPVTRKLCPTREAPVVIVVIETEWAVHVRKRQFRGWAERREGVS